MAARDRIDGVDISIVAKLGSRSDELGSRQYDSGLLISAVFGDSKKVRTVIAGDDWIRRYLK